MNINLLFNPKYGINSHVANLLRLNNSAPRMSVIYALLPVLYKICKPNSIIQIWLEFNRSSQLTNALLKLLPVIWLIIAEVQYTMHSSYHMHHQL